MKARKITSESNVVSQGIMGYNRKQKRQLMKMMHLSMDQINKLTEPKVEVQLNDLQPGTKVKLKYDRILEHKEEKSELYLQFVENHKDQVLTVYQDEKHAGSNLYCLEEDNGPEGAKWLFDISELEVLIEENNFSIQDIKTDVVEEPENNPEN